MRTWKSGLVILPVVAMLACGSVSTGDEVPSGPAAGGGGFDSSGSDPGKQACAATTVKPEGAPVDIIFIVDTSASMAAEMEQVQRNVNVFAESVGSHGLNHRIIMIAERGTGSGFETLKLCVPTPLAGANCQDNAPLFHQVDVGVSSYDLFSILLSTYDGVIDPFNNHGSSTTTAWKSFIRMDAHKIFIAITDDRSDTTAADFDRKLLQKQPVGIFGTAANRKYTFNSIVGWKEGSAPLSTTSHCSSAIDPGVEYQRLSQMTGGLVESVCKDDYSTVLDEVTKGISGRLGCDFDVPHPTSGTVDPRQVVVRFSPGTGEPRPLTQVTDVAKCSQNPDGWYYDDNAKAQRILLCKSTCSAVASDARGKIDIQVGCTAPPPR